MKTEIACVIDRSGSMGIIRNDAIFGFNTFLQDQKKIPGEATLSLVLFNDGYRLVHDSVPIQDVPDLTDETYTPMGSTALYDAIGKLVTNLGMRFSLLDPTFRPDKVVVAILTDGEENASKEYSKEQIAEMIKHHQEKYSWEFIFLAANQDAFATGAGLNIKVSNTLSFDCTARGMSKGYSSLSDLTSSYRK